MKSKIKRKTLALVLAISMILMSLPISGIAVAGENNTAPIIDFTNAAPIFEAPAVTPYVARRSMFASPAQTFALTRGVQKDATGLELSKTATDNGDGTYTITLEAYTTGTVTVTQTTKPLDIVLVLDQSGSMERCINCGAEDWSEKSTCSKAPEAYKPVTTVNNSNSYYVKSGNTYTRVYYCRTCGGWFTEQHHDGFIFIGPSHEGTQVDPTEVQFYEHTGGKHVRRVDALKEAVQTFVDEVYRKAAGADGKHGTDDDVSHRIAIVGFGSNNSNNTELLSITGTNNTVAGTSKKVGVQYSTNLSAQQYKDVLQNLGKDSYANSKAMLDNAIKVLAASGATRADLGMKMAENIYKSNTVDLNERNRVTIMFTDGSPTSYSDFDDTVANSTISSANTQKNTYGATVYTIGVFDGANASNPTGDLPPYNAADSNQENRYMYLVSSNYPDASDMNNNTGDRNPNVTATQSYYMSASSTEALNKIFVAMSTQMGGTTSELDSTTVVKDIVAPSFVLPNGADTNITVTTKDAYYTDGVLDWDNEKPFAAGVTITGNTVDVTGFDFKHNFVAETGRVEGDATQSGNFHGRKLVITFVITPNPDFLGGDGVVTNDVTSGVYDKDGNMVEAFEVPTVNVPLKDIDTVAQDKHIYYGNTTDLTGILNLHVKDSTSGKYLQDIANGINNAYVDLRYDVTLNDNTIVTYTISAGNLWYNGTWTDATGNEIDLNQVTLESDTPYGIHCTMTSSNNPGKSEAADGNATIYVYMPELTFMDSTKKPEETVVFDTENYVSTVWKNGDNLSSDVTMEGNAPELTLTYTPEANCINDSSLIVTYDDFCVDVKVAIGSKDITEAVTFLHNDCNPACSFDAKNGEFMIHVVKVLTSLTIQKAGYSEYENVDPNQTFLFRVEGEGVDLIVTVHGKNPTTINGLKVGSQYKVTELTDWSWRYRFSKWEHKVNADDATTTTGSTNGAAIKLGENGTITFTNERSNPYWLDGDSWCKNIFNSIIEIFE